MLPFLNYIINLFLKSDAAFQIVKFEIDRSSIFLMCGYFEVFVSAV
jgi:hypothetical protein